MSDIFASTVSFIRSHYNEPEAFIPLHEPRFNGNDKKYVLDAIDSTFVSSIGKYVDRFEEMMCSYTGARYAVATVNGTAALHMGLLVAGVQRNDLVISQPFTFIATCNAISYIGAEPLFIDIDRKTLGLSPEKLEAFLEEHADVKGGKCIHKRTGRKISACVPMHTFGLPAEIDRIVEICTRWNIPVVEDAAESIGSFYKDRHTGTTGLVGTFSFNGNKTITCGGGGCIVTDDEKLAKRAKHLTTQAKIPHRWEFRHDMIAYNYRLPNLNAALACAQMEQLDGFLSDKRALAEAYGDFFAGTPFEFIKETPPGRSNYWFNAILLKDKTERDAFLQFTNDNGIMTRPSWTLMNELEMFSDCITGDLGNAGYISDRLVNIPSSAKKQ